jgi:hypothetical protein
MEKKQTGFLQRAMWRLTRAVSERGRRWSWDSQFQNGRWDHIREKAPEVIACVERWSGGGKLVELACGEGVLPQVVRPGTFSEYLGVDISEVATEPRCKKPPTAGFVLGDLKRGGTGSAMRRSRSVCTTRGRQERLLRVALESVAPDGVVMVAIHDRQKHVKLVEWVESSFPLMESSVMRGRALVTLQSSGSSRPRSAALVRPVGDARAGV